MESIYDCFKLNNDMKIPCVGFGTYKAAEGNQDIAILILHPFIRPKIF